MSEEHWNKSLYKKFLEAIFGFECNISSKWAGSAHKRLLWSQWAVSPNPEWFNHDLDLFYQWKVQNKNSFWVERGVFNALALQGGDVLELASGDGFNTKYFYAKRSSKVIACDFDPSAIKHATKKNSYDNIEYILADMRTDMPEGKFENIVCDMAIEHFTEEEIEKLMPAIKSRLTENGILSGCTIVEEDHGEHGKMLHQHEYEFKSKEDLERFLTPYFSNVNVFETIVDNRNSLYFWASDSTVPFDKEWKHSTK